MRISCKDCKHCKTLFNAGPSIILYCNRYPKRGIRAFRIRDKKGDVIYLPDRDYISDNGKKLEIQNCPEYEEKKDESP
ncbi:MAG: hypothetical protein ACTSQ8_18855 [Candidatus Helarchaeota archaeon]